MSILVKMICRLTGASAAVIVNKSGNGYDVYATGRESALMAVLRAIIDEMKKNGKTMEEIIEKAESYLTERQSNNGKN